MSENSLLVFVGCLSFLVLGSYVLIRCLRIFLSSRDIEKITFTHEDLKDIKEVLGLLQKNYENCSDDFSKVELRKIEDLRTFFIFLSNRPSVLLEVKKS